jgi:quaternary ammonium compound-resistance protein SugE
MAWAILFLAGLFEVGWAIGLKYTMGFTRVGPSVATLIAMVASLALLSIAVRTLPIGTAYAMWTGIGTVGAAIRGIALFREPATPLRVVCILLIVVGIVGLKFGAAPPRDASPHATEPR